MAIVLEEAGKDHASGADLADLEREAENRQKAIWRMIDHECKKKTKQQETLAVMRVPTEKFEAAKAEMMKMGRGTGRRKVGGELLTGGYKKASCHLLS